MYYCSFTAIMAAEEKRKQKEQIKMMKQQVMCDVGVYHHVYCSITF